MRTNPVFLSHISEDKELAAYLQEHITRDFLKAIDVFNSDDGVSIDAGSDWLKSLHSALTRAKYVIVLCSPSSVVSPWVNFEVGAAWLKGIPIQPLCRSGLEPEQLKPPFSLLQGGSLTKTETLRSLYLRLSRLAGLDAPDADFEKMVRDMTGIPSVAPVPETVTDVFPGFWRGMQPDLRLLADEMKGIASVVRDSIASSPLSATTDSPELESKRATQPETKTP